MTPGDGATRVRRIDHHPALDGIRGASVAAVVTFHTGVGLVTSGGFLGVDVFFVVSGYLITALLVAEWQQEGKVSLGRFWARRARRLAPALVLVLVAVAAYGRWMAPVTQRDELRTDIWASLLYVANWRFIVQDTTYFGALAAPSPLRHVWSLAIEEQFYLVWPLVLLVVLHLGRRWALRTALTLTVVLAALSAALAVVLYDPVGEPIRVYDGTDTRAQALLIGAALALVLASRSTGSTWTGRGRVVAGVLAMGGAVGTLVAWRVVRAGSPSLYRGGFTVVALLAAALVAGVVVDPRSLVARALSWRPLCWVGERSYGIYLWHWPVIVVLTAPRTGLGRWSLYATRIGATLALAVLSHWLVEAPIRRGALRGRSLRVAVPAALAAVVLAAISLGPGPTPTTTVVAATRPSAPPGTGGDGLVPNDEVKALLVGDSVPFSLGWGMELVEGSYNVEVDNRGAPLCGLALGSPLVVQGGTVPEAVFCPQWPERWEEWVDQGQPDVAALLVGRWELVDRVHEGRWTHIGESTYDRYLRSQIDRAVDILGQGGRPVVLVTMPPIDPPRRPDGTRYPEDDPGRVERFNEMLGQVAAARGPQVTIFDLFGLTAVDGEYARTIDGVDVRDDDGIHFTVDGGAWVAQRLLPALRSAASTDDPGSDQ